MQVAPEVKPKSYQDYKIVGTPVPRVDLPPKLTGEFTLYFGFSTAWNAPRPRGAPLHGDFETHVGR